jgi:hypothetical protein
MPAWCELTVNIENSSQSRLFKSLILIILPVDAIAAQVL